MPRHVTPLKLIAAVISGAFLVGGLAACHRSESTASLIADAKQYQQKGDMKAALIQLKNAVEKSPEDGEARMQLAALELELGDAVSADKELHKARSLGIAADRVLPLMGKAMLQQGHATELLGEISAAQAAHSAALLTLRGDAFLATGHAADAKQSYDQALSLNPNQGDALLGMVRYAISKNDQESAQRYMADALAKDPKNPEVWMLDGGMLRMQNKQDEALAAYDQALKLKPDHRSAHIEKAYLQITRGKFPEAKAEIDAAEKAAPNNLLVTYTRALYDFSQGKFSAAQDSLQKVLKSAPEHMPSILLAGASELNLGATQQAEQHLRHYLNNNPNDVYARKLLAQVLLKSSQPADAAAALEPVLKDSTQDPQLLALAGESYMQVRDFNKATAYLEKAAALAPKAAAVRTSLGLSKLAQGDQAHGMSDLELATTLDPKSPQAAMALVQTQMNLKQYDKALATVQSLEKQQPDNPQVQNTKGAAYLFKGDRANARAAFEKAVALQATYFPAVTNLARMDLEDGKPDAAKGRFQRVLDKDKTNFGAMSALGDLAMAQKKTDEATSWYEKASSANPDAIVPSLKLGAHYLQINQPQKTLALARKLQTSNPTNADLLDLLGQAQIATKDYNGALDTYSKLVNVAPKSAQAQLRLAGVHMLMKRDSDAASDVRHAVELQPDFLPARAAQVQLAMRANRPDDALAVARDLQKTNPKAPAGFALEGDLMMAQKKPAQAIGAYDKALSLKPSSELLIKSLMAMNGAGKGKEAQARTAQWLKDNPTDQAVGMYAAEASLANKDFKPAISQLEGVLKANPNNPAALNNLAWAYGQQKDPRALPTAEQAYKVAGDNPGVMDTLGWLLVEQGDTGRGLPLLKKAGGIAPDAPEIHYHLAVGLHKSGDKQGARKELDKLLAQNRPFPQIEEARALLKTL
jgi:putative PEP-CTERM system TPR-repeat lipoprotein